MQHTTVTAPGIPGRRLRYDAFLDEVEQTVVVSIATTRSTAIVSLST